MAVCVDACFLLRWLLPQQLDPKVYDLVDGWLDSGADLIGPALLHSEVVSVLRHQAHRGTLDKSDAHDLARLFLRLGIRRVENLSLYRRAFDLATRLDHARAYDAHYLAAAEQEGCALWTADGPLYESARRTRTWVHHVSEL